MSTESPDDATTDHEPAPPTVEAILDDLHEAEVAISEEPTHDTTTATVADLAVRLRLPHADVSVSDPGELGLTPHASAWVTPGYTDRDGGVSLRLTASGDTDDRLPTCAELEAADTRVNRLSQRVESLEEENEQLRNQGESNTQNVGGGTSFGSPGSGF